MHRHCSPIHAAQSRVDFKSFIITGDVLTSKRVANKLKQFKLAWPLRPGRWLSLLLLILAFGQGWYTEDIVNTLAALWYSLELVFIDGKLSLTNTAQSTGHHLQQKALHESSLELSLWLYKHEHESDLYFNELVLRLGVEHNIAISVFALHETLKTSGLTGKYLQKIAIRKRFASESAVEKCTGKRGLSSEWIND